MATALFGLLGVVVGGLLSVLTSYVLDRRRGWLAARASALQLIADLDLVRRGLQKGMQDATDLI